MIKVLLTTPNEHWLHKLVCKRVVQILQDGRWRVTWQMPSHRPFENNLHHIVRRFLEGEYDFWLSFDADNPPRRNPLELIELDRDIIGCPTPIWHFQGKQGERPIYWNAYDYVPSEDAYREHVPHEGLQRVDAVGTGCILIARRVFEHPGMQEGAFHRKWHRDGTMHKGNDLAFCERARARDFEIYAHYEYPCDHFSELNLNDVARGFQCWADKKPERQETD